MGTWSRRNPSEIVPLRFYPMHSNIIKFSVLKKKCSLSPSSYEDVVITNKNIKLLSQLIAKNPQKGKEVGSDSYVHESSKFFLRTKALQPDAYLLDITKESAVPIVPRAFINHNLKKGQVLIAKDSNIGEVAYLDNDHPEYMMSAGLLTLEIIENPFYVLAMMKNSIFKKQLNAMVPPGTIIKHAKKLFLNCKIPFPNTKISLTIKFVEELTKAIIRRESMIRDKYQQIGTIFNNELYTNCKKNNFSHYVPKYSDLVENMRFDTGLYEREYISIINCIETYKQGSFFKIPIKFIKSGSTPKNRIIGKGSKKWITPTIFGELGYFTADERILCNENNISRDCIIIKNRTLKEKLGRFVGTAAFYDFAEMGLGHHNQGCYRIEDYPSDKLKYLALVLNTPIYRKICGYISLGSKMREIKMNQFASMPFPDFDKEIKGQLIDLYDRNIEMPKEGVVIDELDYFDSQNIEKIGIIQLARQMQFFQSQLNTTIKKIVDDEEISFNLACLVLP